MYPNKVILYPNARLQILFEVYKSKSFGGSFDNDDWEMKKKGKTRRRGKVMAAKGQPSLSDTTHHALSEESSFDQDQLPERSFMQLERCIATWKKKKTALLVSPIFIEGKRKRERLSSGSRFG